MVIVVYLVKGCGYKYQNRFEKRGAEWKVLLLKGTVIAGGLMCLFYWWHNTYCDPYIYSFFGICEYLLVLFNIAFHGTAYYDFYFSDIIVTKSIPIGLTTPTQKKNHLLNRSNASDQEPLLQSIEVQ